MMRAARKDPTLRRGLVTAVVGLSLALTACAGADGSADDASGADPVAAAVSVEDDAASASPTAAEGDADAPLATVTYDVVLSRDPFDPVREPPEETDTADGASDDDSSTPGVPGGAPTPGTPVDPGTGTPVDGPACSTYGDVVCDGISIALLDVTTSNGTPIAVVQVDTFVLELEAGTTFFGRFRINSIDGNCVSFAYGDEPFSLCEGDQILK